MDLIVSAEISAYAKITGRNRRAYNPMKVAAIGLYHCLIV